MLYFSNIKVLLLKKSMRTLRVILLIFLIIIALAFAIGFLLPETAYVSRSMLIHARNDLIFDQINTIQNWEKWSPWSSLSNSVKIEYSGPEQGANAAFSWTSLSNKTGNGKIAIIGSYPYDSVIFSMDFSDRGNALGKFTFSNRDSATLVTMSMTSELGSNPINRYFGLFMNRLVGKDFNKSLMTLQQYVCSLPEPLERFKIIETDIPPCITLTIRDTCNNQSVNSKLSSIYQKIFNIIKLEKLRVSGSPFTVYHSVTPGMMDIEAGISVDRILYLQDDTTLIFNEYPQRHALVVNYFGSRKGISQVYKDLRKFAIANKIKSEGTILEEYVTDTSIEKDTAKWQTNVYLILK
jgi:effector-binding domain-containing protein